MLQKLDLNWAFNATLPPLEFVLPGLLPGSLGLIVAPGGTGKSQLALDIAVSKALGRPVAGGLFPAAPPCKVVVLAGEESDRLIAERLRPLVHVDEQSAPCLYENLIIFPMAGESCLLLEHGKPTKLYHDLKSGAQGASLVIVDPVRRMHNGDENSSGEMADFVTAMERLAKSTGAAVVGLHHANRVSVGDTASQNAARGSSALVDGSRWQINLSRMDEKTAERHMIAQADRTSYLALDFAKTNYLPPRPRSWLMRGPDGQLSSVMLPISTSKSRSVSAAKATHY